MKFKDMGISGRTTLALDEMKYVDATEVQEKTIPLILQGEDIIVRSQTGTGKTAAFGIPIIEMISVDKNKKCLILAPTRELALQITKELREIAQNQHLNIFAVYGGAGMWEQRDRLRKGFDILIATPGRLLDHLQQGNTRLNQVNIVVLDEADRMLDIGFKPDIDRILDLVNPERKTYLFSATIDNRIKGMSRVYLHDPKTIEVGDVGKVVEIAEHTIHVSRAEKLPKLHGILQQDPGSKAIVFVRSKHSVEFVCRKLKQNGVRADFLHGGKSQNQRERTMREFKQGRFDILIATDVAARGLHIDDVNHVINYDEADCADTHTHRIGRTGRMGKAGKATTLIETDPLPRKPHAGKNRNRFSGQSSHGQSQHRHSSNKRPRQESGQGQSFGQGQRGNHGSGQGSGGRRQRRR